MKNRIYHSLCLIALLSLFLSTFASLSLYMSFHNQDKQEDLQSHCHDLAVAATEIENLGGNVLAFLQQAADPSVRITLIQPNGLVIWDSVMDAATMENHSDRIEFVEAMEGEMGQDARVSDTTGQDAYYCALRFGAQNHVLRLGRNQTNIVATLMQILPLDMFSCVLLFVVCLILANKETSRILNPMLKAANHLETLESGDFYEELTPFINTIRRQNATIRAQLASIQRDKDTITFVLKNMKEGLVMVSQEKRILSVNMSALSMLECYDTNIEGQNFLTLTREGRLIQAVQQALNGENCSGYLESQKNDRIYQYFANPVLSTEENQENSGAILFLIDVTEQQRAQKSREEFSANVSHELKTPLTSISGFAELMESGMVASSDDVKQFSGLIRKEASRLLTLIDDIIRLSRINDSNEMPREAIDLYELVQEECEHLLPAAEKRNITVQCQGSQGIIYGNPTMLQEAVYNLCENAVKYNKDHGFVHVTVTPRERQVLLTVQDSGIGIPKEHHDRIFERFYRVDKSRSKETGGTGLGLSIVKHIIQQHNGQLNIDSTPGQGTTITIAFPTLTESLK